MTNQKQIKDMNLKERFNYAKKKNISLDIFSEKPQIDIKKLHAFRKYKSRNTFDFIHRLEDGFYVLARNLSSLKYDVFKGQKFSKWNLRGHYLAYKTGKAIEIECEEYEISLHYKNEWDSTTHCPSSFLKFKEKKSNIQVKITNNEVLSSVSCNEFTQFILNYISIELNKLYLEIEKNKWFSFNHGKLIDPSHVKIEKVRGTDEQSVQVVSCEGYNRRIYDLRFTPFMVEKPKNVIQLVEEKDENEEEEVVLKEYPTVLSKGIELFNFKSLNLYHEKIKPEKRASRVLNFQYVAFEEQFVHKYRLSGALLALKRNDGDLTYDLECHIVKLAEYPTSIFLCSFGKFDTMGYPLNRNSRFSNTLLDSIFYKIDYSIETIDELMNQIYQQITFLSNERFEALNMYM